MRLLLDTHALIWLLSGDRRLGPLATDMITDRDNEVWTSVVSLWEMQVKARIGKLKADLQEVLRALPKAGVSVLQLRPGHLVELGRLEVVKDHRDPFDHLLIAQAMAEGLTFVSDDRRAGLYRVPVAACGA